MDDEPIPFTVYFMGYEISAPGTPAEIAQTVLLAARAMQDVYRKRLIRVLSKFYEGRHSNG